MGNDVDAARRASLSAVGHVLWYVASRRAAPRLRAGRPGRRAQLALDPPREALARRRCVTGPGALGSARSSIAAIGITSRTVEAMNGLLGGREVVERAERLGGARSSTIRRRVIESRIRSSSGGV